MNKQQQFEFFYRIFQDLVDFAIFTMDLEGRITSWNAGARKIFGYDEQEILGQPLATIFTNADQMTQQMEWEMTTARETGRADDERWHVRKNGERFWASGVLAVVRDKSGNISGFVKVVRDLTERKRAEEQREELLEELQRANQAKDRFLATLSHELRTPLSAIMGWVSLMHDKQLGPDKVDAAIESTYRNAQIQKGLIDDLLDMSRISVGQLSLENRIVHLPEIIRHALDSVRFMAAHKHIEVDSDVEETIPAISGDARRLQQIIWNLLTNAVKFTPDGGRIILHAHHQDRNVQIQISDTGQGMSPDFMPYAFDTFRQEQDSTTRPYNGMGLGLAIVKQLTELHGGKVSAFSAGVGKGSTFTVTLPVVDMAAAAGQAAQRAGARLQALAQKRVLILENDLDCREFLSMAIQAHGGAVQTAATVPEGLEKVIIFRPDVLLVDIALPEENGYEFLKKLKASVNPDLRNIPAIALTALAGDEFRKRALAEGFQLFIAKPATADEIVSSIAGLLRPADSQQHRGVPDVSMIPGGESEHLKV